MKKTTETINGTTYTVKVLKTRGPRKGETWAAGRGAQGAALGQVGTADRALGHATGKGKTGTLTPAAGLGATGVYNLEKTVATYKAVAAAGRRAEARLRAAEKLDDLLAGVRLG